MIARGIVLTVIDGDFDIAQVSQIRVRSPSKGVDRYHVPIVRICINKVAVHRANADHSLAYQIHQCINHSLRKNKRERSRLIRNQNFPGWDTTKDNGTVPSCTADRAFSNEISQIGSNQETRVGIVVKVYD